MLTRFKNFLAFAVILGLPLWMSWLAYYLSL